VSNPKPDLVMASDRLARTAGPVWEDFLKAFAAYSANRVKECVQAPVDKVMVAQGRAQETAALFELFTTAKDEAAILQSRMKPK